MKKKTIKLTQGEIASILHSLVKDKNFWLRVAHSHRHLTHNGEKEATIAENAALECDNLAKRFNKLFDEFNEEK